MNQQKVTVRILDREYQFAATDEERPALLTAADQLDATMRSIKRNNTTLGADKVAIMAALNISHEMMQLKNAHDKIGSLRDSLNNALENK
jgi:cell division protein ZapA